MVIFTDKDILGSFCAALDVEWLVVDESSALFFTADGPPDYVYCRRIGDRISVEIEEEARTSLLVLIATEIEKRRCKPKKGHLKYELIALVLFGRMLKR